MKYNIENNLNNKTMTLLGQGQVFTVPNVAIVQLGVVTTGENLVDTQAENALISQQIIQTLQSIGVVDIKTAQYSINKVYDYENGRQIDRGYSVRSILEIKTNNLEMVGNIIDSAVSSGANVVELISFDIVKKDYLYQQALNLAILNAMQKSKSISMNLNITNEPVPVRIVENSRTPIQPYFRQDLAAATPILPGNLRIEAEVTIDFAF